MGKAVNEEVIDLNPMPQLRRSAEHRDLANMGSQKGKKRLPQFLNASFDVGTALAPLNTRSKDKEGPSTARRGKRALGGRIRREPLWRDQSNPTKVISRNR